MKKHVLSFVMAVVMLLSICPRAFAMENAVVNGGKIVIPSLEQLAPNETASYTIEETGGSKAVIEVKKISSSRVPRLDRLLGVIYNNFTFKGEKL